MEAKALKGSKKFEKVKIEPEVLGRSVI